MRQRIIFGTLLAWLGLTVWACAEPTKRVATIDVDGVEIRSGNALAYPAVGSLRKGDTVIVLREEETHFLAIQPPPGSLSWIKAIHVGKVELGETKKANVPVAVNGADVAAGSDLVSGPSSRITVRLPQGTIVEIIAAPIRVDNATWYPITPPEGDLRWIPKNAVRAAATVSLAPPPPYLRPDPPSYNVGTEATRPPDSGSKPATKLPNVLTAHKLWSQATYAEQQKDYTTAKGLYARIYHDLWEQKADRDAIVICYNRYKRCDEAAKEGDAPRIPKNPPPPPSRSESRREPPRTDNTDNERPVEAKWSGPGILREVSRVFVDGQQVYALQDDRGQVLYYTTAAGNTNLKSFHDRRVQLYGVVSQKPTLYRPHLAAERIESAK